MNADARRLRRLGELGIDVWQRRCRPAEESEARATAGTTAAPDPAATDPARESPSIPAVSSNTDVPRIRLASGRGRWLLLGDGTDRPNVRALLDDLRGLLGPENCRFGQWSDSAESGVASEDWAERGIDWVLDFGGPGAADARVVGLPALEELARSPEARRQLWHTLRPLLEND